MAISCHFHIACTGDFLHLGTWNFLVTTALSSTRFTNRPPRSRPIAIAQSNAQRFTVGRLTTRPGIDDAKKMGEDDAMPCPPVGNILHICFGGRFSIFWRYPCSHKINKENTCTSSTLRLRYFDELPVFSRNTIRTTPHIVDFPVALQAGQTSGSDHLVDAGFLPFSKVLWHDWPTNLHQIGSLVFWRFGMLCLLFMGMNECPFT